MYKSSKINQEIFPRHMKLLAEVAIGQEYEVEWLDRWAGYLLKINGKHFGYGKVAKFPLNSASARSLCRDKVFSYMLLEEAGIVVPEGDYFIRRDPNYLEYSQGRGIEEAKIFARHMGYPVFVKPNSMSLGKMCRKIYDQEEFVSHMQDIFSIDYIALVQRVIEGREYRVVVLDGEIILCYEKSAPKVVGDGQTNLSVLLEKLKEGKKGQLDIDWQMLNKKGYNTDSVLRDREELLLKDTANLNSGGWVVEVVRNFPEQLLAFSKRVTEVMGVRLCGIDVVCRDLYQSDDYVVLEVNADPGFEAFMEYDVEMTKDVLAKIIKACL